MPQKLANLSYLHGVQHYRLWGWLAWGGFACDTAAYAASSLPSGFDRATQLRGHIPYRDLRQESCFQLRWPNLRWDWLAMANTAPHLSCSKYGPSLMVGIAVCFHFFGGVTAGRGWCSTSAGVGRRKAIQNNWGILGNSVGRYIVVCRRGIPDWGPG